MRRRDLSLLVIALGLVLIASGVLAGQADDDVGEPPRRTTSSTPVSVELRPSRFGADGVGDPYYPGLGNGGYDVEHYDLDLEWYGGALNGVVDLTVVATADLDRFNLDFVGLEVLAVEVDDVDAEHVHQDRELVITPSLPIAEGDRFEVHVQYQGVPRPISEGTNIFDVGWHADGDEVFVVNEPSGAATFFPVNDHPTDKATYTIQVEAPPEQTVAANGLLVGEPEFVDEGGGKVWTYEMDDPMASYLVQIAIGDFELVTEPAVGGVQVRHALHRAVLDDARSATARTGEMLSFLAELFGPFPFDVYGVVVVDEELGFALETQTLTLLGSDIAAAGPGADDVLLHEMAHQWFGDSVSPATWRDIWLNEGFATYAEWLWGERTGGRPAAETARQFGRSSFGDLDLPAGDPGPEELFSATVYFRGAMTLQALRERVGDDAFFQILRRWADDHRHEVASTEDFIDLAEAVAGQDLGDLFDAWLYEPALPTLD